MRCRCVHGPFDCLRLDDEADELEPVEAMDPREVLPSRSERPADAAAEGREHPGQRAAGSLEYETGAQGNRPYAGTRRARGFAFPLDAQPREEVVARRRVLRERFAAVGAVVADGAGADERVRRLARCRERFDERACRTEAAVAQRLLASRGPAPLS